MILCITLLAALPPADQIIDVLDYQIVSTCQVGFQKFFVRWQNLPIFNATRITATDFQPLNLDLYECYQAIKSPESSSSKSGRVDAVQKPKKANEPK